MDDGDDAPQVGHAAHLWHVARHHRRAVVRQREHFASHRTWYYLAIWFGNWVAGSWCGMSAIPAFTGAADGLFRSLRPRLRAGVSTYFQQKTLAKQIETMSNASAASSPISPRLTAQFRTWISGEWHMYREKDTSPKKSNGRELKIADTALGPDTTARINKAKLVDANGRRVGTYIATKSMAIATHSM